MSVLPDHQIEFYSESVGLILPFTKSQLQPASYDVRLDSEFLVPNDQNETIYLNKPLPDTLYCKNIISDTYGFALKPGGFVLGATVEKVHIPRALVGRIEGKSTIGRIGLTAHVTAGYLDPGFRGKVTLEIVNLFSKTLVLYPGMLIAQLGFEFLESPCATPYGSEELASHYQDSEGVVGARYNV